MLKVVQDQQRVPGTQIVTHLLFRCTFALQLQPQGSCYNQHQIFGLGNRRQRHPADTVVKAVNLLPGCRNCQAGLAHPPGAEDRDHSAWQDLPAAVPVRRVPRFYR